MFYLKKSQFLTQKGVKIQNFKNSKKVPLDISEIHVVSKFGPIWMKIAAGSSSEPHTHTHTDGLFSTLVHYYTYTAYLLGHNYHTYLTRLTHN